MPRIKENSLNFCPPYAKDIKTLLSNYLKHENCFSIKTFKEEWKKLKFSLIHQGKPEDVSGKIYLQELYCTCLGYLLLTDNLQLKVAVIYTLYFLYETQPLKPKEKISITVELFKELFSLRQTSKDRLLVDTFQVLNALREHSAFCFSAVVKIDPILSNLDSNLNGKFQFKPLEDEIINSRNYDQLFELEPDICESYMQLKSQIFNSVSNPTILQSALSILNPNFIDEIQTSVHLFTEEEPNRRAAFMREVYSSQKSLPRVSKKSKLTTSSLLKSTPIKRKTKGVVTVATANSDELLKQIITVEEETSEETLQELYQTVVKMEEDEVRAFGDGRAERRIDETPILQQQIQQELKQQEEEKKKGKKRRKTDKTTEQQTTTVVATEKVPKPVLTEQEQKEKEKKRRAYMKQAKQLQNGDLNLTALANESKKKRKKKSTTEEPKGDVGSIIDSFLKDDLIDEDDLSPLSDDENQQEQEQQEEDIFAPPVPPLQQKKTKSSKKKQSKVPSTSSITPRRSVRKSIPTSITVVEDETAVTASSSNAAIMSEEALQKLMGGNLYSAIKQEEHE